LVAKHFFGEVASLWAHMSPSLTSPHRGGDGFIPPLSEGEEAPEAVYLALVEKVRVLWDDCAGHAC
jgi:hypothetical protein